MLNCVFLNGNTVEMALGIESESIESVAEMYCWDKQNILLFDSLEDLPEYKEGYILKYDGSSFYYEEIQPPEPTETDIINAEILLNQADIIAKQNEHDEVLAEILLNQMGGVINERKL